MKPWKKQLFALILASTSLLTTAYAVDYIEPPSVDGSTSTGSDSEGTEGEGTEGDGTEGEEEVITGFQDIEGHWAQESIQALSDKGLVTGMSEGVFAPNSPMKRAEFLTIVVRYLYPTAEFHTGTYWYSGYFNTAEAEGLLPLTYREKYMEQDITRQEMAYIMVAALEILGETQEELLSWKLIPDYSTIGETYKDTVIKAFSMGIISGKDDERNFFPNDTATRAECTIVLEKMVSPDSRLEVDFGINPGAMTDMNRLDLAYTKSRANLTYSLTDPERPVAKVGDIVIINGTETPVVAHPTMAAANEMPVPYVAGVALDNGINTNSAHGTVGDGFSGGGVHFNGQTYYINPQTGEGFWQSQWSALEIRITRPRTSGTTEGQVSTDAYKMWTWSMETRTWVASYLYGRE